MASTAFASPLSVTLSTTRRLSAAISPRLAPCVARSPRVAAVRMASNDADEAKRPSTSSSTSEPEPEPEPETDAYAAPSFDTAVFSDFVDSAQAKLDSVQAQVADIDTEALTGDVKAAGIGLVDNVIAGDWLNRGELYGGVQLLFVVLLLRTPGFLDSLIGFAVGPLTLAVGAVISGKAVWDLGRKQLSIWPAPVPGAELQTGGLYNVVRHPVYSGLLLACLGFSAASGSPERLALTIGFAFFLSKKIAVEEDFLVDTYADYEEYMENVPDRLIPRIW